MQGESCRGPGLAARPVPEFREYGTEVCRRADPVREAHLLRRLGVGLPAAGDAPVAGHRKPGGERLERGQPAGVLDQHVAGVQKLRHVVHPAEGVLDAVLPQLLGRRCVRGQPEPGATHIA